MKLSIIIVNFNGKHFFDACLKSIVENVPFAHEVIVVDNASSDGSVEYLRNNYMHVRVIENERNLGFAAGTNLGAGLAQGDYLLLLNNDTLLLDDLSQAVELMESNGAIGALGARMLDKNREYNHSAGYFPAPWRLLRFSLLFQNEGGFRDGVFSCHDQYHPVDWVEGSFLLTPVTVWRELGGLDERYFMYVEDVDYAYRVAALGKRVVFSPRVSYIHFGGSTQERVVVLAKGFRLYHEAHSGYLKKSLANVCLDLGLLVKGVCYLAWAVCHGRKFERAALFFHALKRRP